LVLEVDGFEEEEVDAAPVHVYLKDTCQSRYSMRLNTSLENTNNRLILHILIQHLGRKKAKVRKSRDTVLKLSWCTLFSNFKHPTPDFRLHA
jgi:hypothetical protein